MRGFNPFQWFAREVDAARLGIVDAPQLEDARPIPSPSELLVSDADQIASLRYQLDNANAEVARLQEQLLRPIPAPPAGDRWCPHCPGLEQTIELLKDERASLRRRLAGHELAATRERRIDRVTEQLETS